MLGIVSHLPWATRWLDQFVDFIGLGLAAVNIGNFIVDQRIKNGSMSRDLIFHLVRFRSISVTEKQRVVLIIHKSDEDGKGIMQQTRAQLVLEALAAMIAGYVMFSRCAFSINPQLTFIGIAIVPTLSLRRFRICGTTSCPTRVTTNVSGRRSMPCFCVEKIRQIKNAL